MRIVVIFAGLVITATSTFAGPYCGGGPWGTWAIPSGTRLPRHPTIAYVVEDSSVLQLHGSKSKAASFQRIAATLDGAPVRLRIRDLRASHATIRLVEAVSSKTGALHFTHPDAPELQNDADYEVVADWKPPTVTATTSRFHTSKARMMTVDRDGLAIAFDAPTLLARVRWRAREGAWLSMVVPIVSRGGKAEAWIGETDCWNEEIPLSTLESGVELKLALELPDRSEQQLDLGRIVLLPKPTKP
jgi:hypothetical protein